MHLLRIILLVGLTLAAMRLMSWSFLWLLGWVSRRDSVYLRLASNVMALLAYAAFLAVDSVPGELLDTQALVFGVIVFGIFFCVDARWLPRCVLTRIRARDVPPARS
jgi:hypothetical protein